MGRGSGPVAVFYSYSHKDDKFRVQLDTHLSLLKRRGLLKEWHDRKIVPGESWVTAIDTHLEAADLILLLVSADFIASDYCWSKEMTRALERHDAGTAVLVPIIVRPTDWSGAPFGRLQALPKDGKPLTIWSNRDSAWLDVAKGIARLAETIAKGEPVESFEPAGQGASATRLPGTLAAAAPAATPAPAAAVTAVAARPSPPKERREAGLRRLVYDASLSEEIPGRLVRSEGDRPTGDPAADEAYDGMGAAFDFFWSVFGRSSIDDQGLPLEATVHFGQSFVNAFWDGKRMVLGDGDGRVFKRLTSVDIIGKEFGNAVLQNMTKLVYWDQSGSLFDSLAVAFATLIKQYALRQSADQADWTLGSGLFMPDVRARGLVSLALPGTAYNDPRLGRDPQPSHMRDYVKTTQDNGGVHINSGIPNHAFYIAAVSLGGHAWETVGRIWYEAVRRGPLPKNAQFADFARLTVAQARALFGKNGAEAEAVSDAWRRVGVVPRPAAHGRARKR